MTNRELLERLKDLNEEQLDQKVLIVIDESAETYSRSYFIDNIDLEENAYEVSCPAIVAY